MPRERFWRDSSGRLTVDQPGIDSAQYPAVCRAIANAFSLAPNADFLVGPDQVFSEFRRGDEIVGMDWDNWMEFMVFAKTPAAETLVREIGSWLDANYGRPAAGYDSALDWPGR